jgi:hypothetical protein
MLPELPPLPESTHLSEVHQLLQGVVQAEQSYEYPPMQPQVEAKRGTITQLANNTGLIQATDGKDYMFYLRSITRGFAEIGKSVRFQTNGDDFATSIEIE